MTTRKHIILPQDLADRVRRYRFGAEIAYEAVAIRNLIEAGLAALSGSEDHGRYAISDSGRDAEPLPGDQEPS